MDLNFVKDFLLQHAVGIGGGTALGIGLWAAARYLPSAFGAWLKGAFLRARASGQILATPKRAAAYLAVLEWVEDEVPDKGDPKEQAWFDAAGAWVASHLPPVIAGTPAAWARLIRSMSDEFDADLKQEIGAARAATQPQGPPAQ